MSDSIYDIYGGFSTISTIVHKFYEKIKEEDNLQKYFLGIDWQRLIDHQTKFLCKVLGGPDNYSGKSLAAAHKHLQISEEDFLLVGEILQETLEEAGMSEEHINTVLNVVISVKDQIVEKAA
ncbi:MAG: group 1 truncated hemoglobin [Bdellovibrionota bacterium]